MSLIQKRLFSLTSRVRSHVGASVIYSNPETQISLRALDPPRLIQKGRKFLKLSQEVTVLGPKGQVVMDVPDFARIVTDEETHRIHVSVDDDSNKIQKAMWGTLRAHMNNHVVGVNEGHLAILRFVGTGYRAQVDKDGKYVGVKVGASIPQGLDVPEGITVKSPTPTTLIIEGCDKQQVFLFAAKLRDFHPPEPYKGKGIYVNDETIKIKNKKIK
ncbi:similar to Saccharomyces cerevisiae YHR147C MRPL6 Mitochondrial ribosomal protein of the large subunit [Maudiozyma saulgeensis]|uniref:Large ribosomal subunit protein uL6m n=1 Tax=Maudiozyma saulgeensis TaxID=1789683 RepID=A0A1X7R5K8_9SACH|nr:similar to Saccharomyces cerevisiae YHR147C MRPL6 Mitochondrial ribosomal protein of the large subunit [Kazachstania saulgeensis]